MPREDDEAEVLALNAAFYAAFAAHDVDALEALWARELEVVCVHPGWEPLRGREAVLASFRAILQHDPPAISCRDPSVHLYGEAGLVVCTEAFPGGNLVATNVFVRERGRFRMVHHQASPAARTARPPPAPPRRDVN